MLITGGFSEGGAMTDRQLVEALFSPGKELWRAYRRHGHLHLLVKSGHEANGLTLYRPHLKWPAFAVEVVKFLAKCGLHFPSTKLELSTSERGAIQAIESEKNEVVIAVMFGNPKQSARRVVALTQSHTIYKIGVSGPARDVVTREKNLLQQIRGLPHCPDLDRVVIRDDFEAFSLPWYDPWEGDQVETILDSWSGGAFRELKDFPEWPSIAKFCPELSGSRKVAVALEHGDFAPWNLRVDRIGRAVAIDWEMATVEGMAGRDLIHYHLQTLLLLKGLGLRAAVRELVRRIESSIWIGRWGWSAHDLLLVSLASSWVIPEAQRREVLAWIP